MPGRLDQLTGGYLYDRRIVDGLRARGHRVEVIELGACRPPLDPLAALRLYTATRRSAAEMVVVDELAYPALALARPLLRRFGRPERPLIALVHHLRASETEAPLSRGLAALAERAALAGLDGAVCTSRATADALRHFTVGRLPVAVVPPGCDLHGRAPIGRSAPPASGSFRYLLVAHWTARKGVLETLRALAELPPGLTLDLVGDPGRDRRYAARVRRELRRPELTGRVRVHGRVPSAALAQLYAEAHGLVLASSHEGYGMALAEGLAFGLPIVATRVGGVPEVVRDGLEAELVAPGDGPALQRALARLAGDPAEWRRRTDHASERAATLPSWEESEVAFERVLLAAVESQAGGGSGGRPAAERADVGEPRV